ncbi:CHASE2 domain-containing protein [Rhizobium sp. TRM95111]|nr:CHASE2 domain-containing protein [Rhizobium alarense]MCF3639139.1 CHASE2 domain-containing protein [Rhizobium alarense]
MLAGLLTGLVGAALLLAFGDTALERQRELYFDALTRWATVPQSDRLLVVDIDRKSFAAAPERDWSRAQTAELVEALAAAKPAAVAFDFVFSTDCEPTDPANTALALGISKVPTVLGFLIGEDGGETPRPVPALAIQRPVAISDLWFLEGTENSCPFLQDKAASTAAAFLVGDEDSLVRRVQAYSIVGKAAYPALGVEAARLAARARTPILGGEPAWIRHDARIIDLDEDGNLRFVASDAEEITARTVSAIDVIEGKVAAERITDRMVLIGSSLPNLGGLRASASMPLEPSVQIHADVANGILSGFLPYRIQAAIPWEALAAFLAGAVLAFAGIWLRPINAALVGTAVLLAIAGVSAFVFLQTAHLIDAPGIAAVALVALVVTSVLQFAETRRAEATARRRFAQYLPQAVVSRYIDEPDSGRVAGEERQVTALFTDIESFSTLANQIGPQELVRLLDIYFTEVNGLVARHGGMVDKVVGDAVHAFFNAPEDLDRHVDKAIDCAVAIHELTEEMRRRPQFAAHDFGRTRIGIETGMAVLGEVGGFGGKLDYTAHGEAINLAARLQEANKFLGTAICIGPQAASETAHAMRPLGVHEIRGFGTMELFTPA